MNTQVSLKERSLELLPYIALAVIAVFILAWVFWSARHPGFVSPAAEECRSAYKSAATIGDSNRVDARVVVTNKKDAINKYTCGQLRLAGEIR